MAGVSLSTSLHWFAHDRRPDPSTHYVEHLLTQAKDQGRSVTADGHFTCNVNPNSLTYNHMVVDIRETNGADQVFHALADGTRRDIVRRTLECEHSVSALADLYPMSFAAVQKHVAVLERAQLVSKRPHGREQLVRANVHTIREAFELLERLEALWRGRIDRMDEILQHDQEKGGTP
jgi:DNA-binding transcriptional ArsR family regulator